jgi:hypothetical protein
LLEALKRKLRLVRKTWYMRDMSEQQMHIGQRKPKKRIGIASLPTSLSTGILARMSKKIHVGKRATNKRFSRV